MKKTVHRTNWAMYTAAVLLCLTLITTSLVAGLYARYYTGTTTGDSARVTSFDVHSDGIYEANLFFDDMYPGISRSWSFDISNYSETAVKCEVLLRSTGNLPLKFTVTAGKSNPIELIPGAAIDLQEIGPNQISPATYTLTATWDAGQNDSRYAGEVDALKLILTVKQVD